MISRNLLTLNRQHPRLRCASAFGRSSDDRRFEPCSARSYDRVHVILARVSIRAPCPLLGRMPPCPAPLGRHLWPFSVEPSAQRRGRRARRLEALRRIVHRADGLRQGDAGDADRSRGDIRPGYVGDGLGRLRRDAHARQWRPSHGGYSHQRPRQGNGNGRTRRGGLCVSQFQRPLHRCTVWWVEAKRYREEECFDKIIS